jgi:Domain of unknown function (DUF222)
VGVFEQLGTAVETLDIPLDGDALATVIALRDRLEARISDTIAAYDAAGLWELDGATSMTGWLADRGGMAHPRAAASAARARKLARLSVTPRAWRDGVLSSGQVEAIAANLDAPTLELFAAHEAAVVPALVDLSPPDVTTAMRAWREAASPDPDPKPERPQVLHLSRTLADRWRTDGTLGPETGELLATALRLAQTPDDEGQPRPLPATRRADALGDICRHFLDHQQTRRGGRHRPHLNLIIDLERHLTHPTAGATTPDGTRLDRPSVDRLLCDAALHRMLTAGRTTILDYGTATHTIPAPLFNALVIRDRHCRFPGCDRPTHWCESHHIRCWDHGGPTQLANLVLVCSRHHHLLHRPGWHAKLLPDATLEITDPHRRVRTTTPPDRAPPLPYGA